MEHRHVSRAELADKVSELEHGIGHVVGIEDKEGTLDVVAVRNPFEGKHFPMLAVESNFLKADFRKELRELQTKRICCFPNDVHFLTSASGCCGLCGSRLSPRGRVGRL